MWFDKYYSQRKRLMIFFVLISIGCAAMIPFLKFSFNFEQFFPQGDDDLEFFKEFTEEFEGDDSFLLIALTNNPSVFDTSFLRKVDDFSIDAKDSIPYLKTLQSITNFRYPVITPFGPSSVPAINIDAPENFEKDSINLLNDERILYNLINEKATATVIVIKTEDDIQIKESEEIMSEVKELLATHKIKNYHILGRAYFQTELSKLQFREILLSTIVSGILISIIMIWLFRKWRSIIIALGSIGVGLIIFMGILSLLGRELTLMAALYPILMLIVGTSDVIHIMTKYFDELDNGNTKKKAMEITVKQIGLATLLTSLTTAAGFATLLSSRIVPIKDFGINSALGVLIAYIVVIGFTCPLLSYFPKEQLIKKTKTQESWTKILAWAYDFSIRSKNKILISSFVFLVLCMIGISKIHTNYELNINLPKGAKITNDFNFFEEQFAGFRPLELAITINENYDIYDYEVVESISRIENYVKSKEEIATTFSLATIIKSINQMRNGNQYAFYKMPEKETYAQTQKLLKILPQMGADILISQNKDKTRIASKIKDIGAENIKALSADIDKWISLNVDDQVLQIKQTGTGLILDKNSEFVRESLLYGLGMALIIVSILMGLLFKNIKMLFLALVPNMIPLIFAAALIGYLNIALEAGVSIVFAIIFGIAVDDTIHFLSKYKLAYDKHQDQEKALYITFQESGKAIIYTTLILFAGFMILLFSVNQPSVTIGLLISVTLISALVADLTLLPYLIRKFKIK